MDIVVKIGTFVNDHIISAKYADDMIVCGNMLIGLGIILGLVILAIKSRNALGGK